MGLNGTGSSDDPPYPYAEQQQPQPGSDGGSRYTYLVSVVISLLIVVAIVRLARYILGPPNEAQPTGSVDGDGEPPAEVALDVRAPGPVLCAYRRGDGWREPTCPVCLSDFAEGETVRVLPACMHYFHPACVGEWLRGNGTCPVCRAAPPPPSPAAAGSPVKATSTA